MTPTEVAEVVAVLATAYRPGEFPCERAEVYERALVELDREKLELAVMRLLRTHKFPPAIAEIFETYAIVEHGRPLEVGEAYDLTCRAIRYVGAYRTMPTDGRYALPDRVARTVCALGGWEMVCTHEHEESFRARFFEVYGSLSRVDSDDRSARSVALPEGVSDLTFRRLSAKT
jgi:hypothetical protein